MAINIPEDKIKVAEAEAKKDFDAPAGYITVELSTKGKIGAPAKFHIRNFLTEDLMDLALTDQEELPIQVVKLMQEIIYEKDVDVKKFHEKEVIETLFILYKNFYATKLKDIPWELTEDDKDYLAKQLGGKDSEEYQKQVSAYEKGLWKRTWDIDLNKVKTYDIPDNIKTHVHVVKKSSGFNYDYELPKYGDILILRPFIENVFKDKDKKYASLQEQIKHKQKMDKDFEEQKSNVSGARIFIPKNEMDEYKAYEKEKVIFAARCMKALHLAKVNGEDVTKLSLEDRIKLVENPEFDHATYRQASEALDNIKFGLKEEMKGFDPILNKVVDTKYSFRVFDLLLAIRDNDSDEVIITLE